ncbi:hypothetical protein ABID59_005633 [Bradyrhizobium sp. S3.3.6]|uniref:hypothetical protein n=1 Tax=Bradyrhizobium sp. S3.3.6 TaxID=3156429 RepID=UPI003390B90C
MSRVDTSSAIDRLIVPIVELAGENLMSLPDPSFDFVPDKMREGISAIHLRLKAELKALLQLRTIYGDMITCRIVAGEYPWILGELSHYQHLRLAWSQLMRLSDLFDEIMKEIDRLHSETLEILSVDVDRAIGCAASGGALRMGAIDRDTRADRWYEVAPQPEPPIFDTMRMASEWSDSAPPFADYYGAARCDLLSQIDATMQTMSSGIVGFLSDHGGELVDLVGRYHDMIRNFRTAASRDMI